MTVRLENRQTLSIPSVLNRLMDDHPHETVESASAMYLDLRRFKLMVANDLQTLLNTRCIDFEDEAKLFPHACNSMLNFGIIDLSSLSLLNPDDRSLLRDKIRITIERHEPRLTKIKVTLSEPKEFERMLRFRVDAVLKMHPNKPPMVFDAMLQLSSNAYQFNDG